MGTFGGFEWVIVIMVVLLLFGAKRIPELARGLGKGISEFRRAQDDIRKEIDRGSEEEEQSKEQQKQSQKSQSASESDSK